MVQRDGPPPLPLTGSVVRIGAKPRIPGEHGLPKPERPMTRIGPYGVEGDYNVYRQEEKAGDPEMALLLMPLETIEALNAEGWPVRPGDLGENLTTRGLPYDALAPPRRLAAGSAEIEVTKACTPCTNLYLLPYIGPERGPEFLRATRDRRGWYARVLRPGVVSRGDPIVALA